MSDRSDAPYGTRRRVDPIRIWAGGVATALVAGGIAWVGVLVIRAIFQIPGIHRLGEDTLNVDQLSLAIIAAVAALLATALLHLLLLGTPRAHRFFAWIIGLIVVGLIVEQMLAGNGWLSSLLISAVYLVIGIAIASLLSGVARTAIHYDPNPRPVQPGQDYQRRDQDYSDPRYNDSRYNDPRYNDPRYDPRSNDPGYRGEDETRRLPPYQS